MLIYVSFDAKFVYIFLLINGINGIMKNKEKIS